ncbi:hypothetical protein [Polaromonas sp. CG9_12]|nr:hypothetical protein [Polaromonas sp. CG9_12]
MWFYQASQVLATISVSTECWTLLETSFNIDLRQLKEKT